MAKYFSGRKAERKGKVWKDMEDVRAQGVSDKFLGVGGMKCLELVESERF